MKKPFIIQRGRKNYFELPSGWELLCFADFNDQKAGQDVKDLARKSLNNPIQSPLIKDCLSPSDSIAVIIEDLTRASPKRLVLEVLLKELESAHIARENIAIIIALGTHREMSSKELAATFGQKLLEQYEFINHDCHAPDLAPAGRLFTGRAVKINRRVHEAAFKIGIGSIFPHPMNGFGGGGKIIFPGVADFDSIVEHHLAFTFHEGTGFGKIEGNLFHDQVCSMAEAAGLNFIINSVLDQKDQVFDIVSGHPVHAHMAGIEKSRKIITQRFPKKSDLTIITSFPYTEGPQIVKPLTPASMVTKEGGCIILAADCTGGLPDAFVESFEKFHSEHGTDLLGSVHEHFEQKRLIMEGAVDFNMALGFTLAIQGSFKIILVSEDIPRETGERMGFIYAGNLQEAFELSAEICPPNPEVHIIPSGGVILPVIS
ncbi:MAG: nickel-dependent lactate racemase [Deltaproteobacteria bacterium]|nr:nickel-dependent lactate racemase [Deltaproteobacteria bacterium]